MDPNLADDIRAVLGEVPPPIRAFFASGKIELITKVLMHENGLHVDQAAVLEREIILLLLGLQSPAEFSHALESDGHIERATVQVIAHEINEQIFIPLREEMRKGGAVSASVSAPAPSPAAPPPQPRVQTPPPSYGAPPPPPPSQPMPAPSPRPMLPPPQVFVPLPPPAPSIVLSPMPPAQVRPAQPPQLGRSDLPNSAPLPPRTVLPGASAPVFHNPMPAPLRQQSEPPSNLPTGVPGPEFAPLPPVARPSSPQPVQPPPRPASGDPYHEPIE